MSLSNHHFVRYSHRVRLWVGVLVLGVACAKPFDRALERGNALAQAGKLEAAQAAYEEAVSEAPDSARAHLLLGNVLMSLQKPEAAVTEWSAAASLSLAREALATHALATHDARAALAVLGAVESPRGRVLQGRALLALARPDETLKALEPVSTAEAEYLKGSALLSLHRWADSQRVFDALERSAPKSSLGPYGMARLAAAQGRAADSLLYLKAAKAMWGPGWSADTVAADPAFAFLSASADYQELLKPQPTP